MLILNYNLSAKFARLPDSHTPSRLPSWLPYPDFRFPNSRFSSKSLSAMRIDLISLHRKDTKALITKAVNDELRDLRLWVFFQ